LEKKEENQENEQRQPPVKTGERIHVKIIGIGKEGDGVAKFEGFVIIVPKTKVDEVLAVEITKVMQRVAFAEVVQEE